MSPIHKVMAKANARAERLRPVMTELAALSANQAAAILNERKVPAPLGGERWYRAQVLRLRKRLAKKQSGEVHRHPPGPDGRRS